MFRALTCYVPPYSNLCRDITGTFPEALSLHWISHVVNQAKASTWLSVVLVRGWPPVTWPSRQVSRQSTKFILHCMVLSSLWRQSEFCAAGTKQINYRARNVNRSSLYAVVALSCHSLDSVAARSFFYGMLIMLLILNYRRHELGW
jgi:hypothetical protein